MKQDTLEGKAKTKKWGKTAVFFHNLHSSGSDFLLLLS